ncbi:hypothetical protein [Peristeroidobacter agariperforans]|uniref:hypothetical protein n=1 Tax=Peristeroidobacter agariperforans TaxID=268404 RepID=UPI00101D90CF|nr:hypothetical protein [Peristeroidobacter agariperforans]
MKRASWIGRARSWPLLAVLLLSACASSPPQQSTSNARPAPGEGDADQMAATAVALWGASPVTNGSQALSQIQKAAQAAPERPEILWLHLRLCTEVPGCEPQPIEARLRKLDPDNGAVWIGPLARAQARGDARAEAQILDMMSQAADFNIYWTTTVARLTPAVSRMPIATSTAQAVPTPLTNAMNVTIGWLSALAIPALRPVTAACDEQDVREPETRVRCERVAKALQNSDTALVEGLGLGLAQRLAIPDSAAAMQVTDKIQTLRHQNQAAGAVVAAQVEKEKFSEQMLKLMDQLKKEQDVSRAILRWAGQPLTP